MAPGKIYPELQLMMAYPFYSDLLNDDPPLFVGEGSALQRIIQQFCKKGIFVVGRQVERDPAAAGGIAQRRQRDLFCRTLVAAEFRPATDPHTKRKGISCVVQHPYAHRQ